ncbi:MAG TPA: flavodoxin family protein [Methanoregulaceae archaeon]|nr:flavodoxin family protein [Methanoregulaceae archaeon]
MKVLGLIASPRGRESRTLQLVKGVLTGAEQEGAATELIDIYSLKIGYCTACGTCYATGDCAIVDDFPALFEKILDSDGIVLGSPNYIDSVTAPLKAVFDRCADAIHCQMLTGKYGCSVCTAGGSNQDVVVNYMNHALTALGATVIGGVGAAIGRDPAALPAAEKEAVDLGRKLVLSINGAIKYPEQDAIHQQRKAYFCQIIKANKDIWKHEYDWWVEMGWMQE